MKGDVACCSWQLGLEQVVAFYGYCWVHHAVRCSFGLWWDLACTYLPYGTVTRLFTCLPTSRLGGWRGRARRHKVGAEQHRLCARCAGCICAAAPIMCTCTWHVCCLGCCCLGCDFVPAAGTCCAVYTTGAPELFFVQFQEWYAAELVVPGRGGICCCSLAPAKDTLLDLAVCMPACVT